MVTKEFLDFTFGMLVGAIILWFILYSTPNNCRVARDALNECEKIYQGMSNV